MNKIENSISFKIGDLVEWTSQASGSTTTKQGTIVMVLPADFKLNQNVSMVDNLVKSLNCSPFDARKLSNFRGTESYLVGVNKNFQDTWLMRYGTKSKLYWPHVSGLKLVRRANENESDSLKYVQESLLAAV